MMMHIISCPRCNTKLTPSPGVPVCVCLRFATTGVWGDIADNKLCCGSRGSRQPAFSSRRNTTTTTHTHTQRQREEDDNQRLFAVHSCGWGSRRGGVSSSSVSVAREGANRVGMTAGAVPAGKRGSHRGGSFWVRRVSSRWWKRLWRKGVAEVHTEKAECRVRRHRGTREETSVWRVPQSTAQEETHHAMQRSGENRGHQTREERGHGWQVQGQTCEKERIPGCRCCFRGRGCMGGSCSASQGVFAGK